MKKKTYIIDGKEVIPEEDTLLCDVRPDPAFSVTETYTQLYTTENGMFYVLECTLKKKSAFPLSLTEAFVFLRNYAAYILTDNYRAVFGEPERG